MNKLNQEIPAHGVDPKSPVGDSNPPMPEKCPNYPGLPGKSQPRNRSSGTPKAKVYPKSEGL